jgi:hypothetical protein
LYSKILQSLSYYQRERLQQLIAPSSPRARWNEARWKNEREMGQENGSITILKRMVRK